MCCFCVSFAFFAKISFFFSFFLCEGRGVTFEDNRGGDAWKAVGEADVPCIGIHGDLESFREGDLEMLLDSDLVRKRVIGGCAVGE